jgi:putative thioredoxin
MPPKDVSEADFPAEVLERSYERPVVVDFWAAWCAPCRHLGPVLERVADSHAGDVELVKVDVDANPGIANAYGIQGIPAVKAFRNGAVVDEFVGNYPEPAVKQFFESILPSEADRLAAAGDAAATPEEAERAYRAALEIDRGQRGAVVGLASILAARREFSEARSLLARLPEDGEIRKLLAHIDLTELAEDGSSSDPLAAAAAEGDWETALEGLLAKVRAGDAEDARRQMIDIFEVLGPADPLTVKYRAALASALF